MPNVQRITAPYLATGNPDTLAVQITGSNITALGSGIYAPGELGCSFDFNGKTYTLVQLASNSAAVTIGAVLYWQDKVNFLVTMTAANCITTAATAFNAVAGIGRIAVTPGTFGTYIAVLVAGSNISVATITGTTVPAAGLIAAANNSNSMSVAGNTTTGTTQLGIFRGAISGGFANIDLNGIPTLA